MGDRIVGGFIVLLLTAALLSAGPETGSDNAPTPTPSVATVQIGSVCP